MLKNKINKSRFYAIITLIFLTTITLISFQNVSAHSPSDLNLTYDIDTQKLNVTISHQVANPDSHYIYSIEIIKNGNIIKTHNYDNQPDTASFTYTYDVNATIGDIIEVSTFCNQGGTRNKQITVGSEDSSSTPGFGVLILLCSIIALIFLKKEKMGGFR